MKSHKVLIIGIFITLFILGAAAILYWKVLNTSVIEITTTPSNAQIKIDGKDVSSNNIKLNAGEHTIEISANGYVPNTQKVVLKRAQKITVNSLLKEVPTITQLATKPISGSYFMRNNYAYYLGSEGRTIYRTLLSLPASPINTEAITPDNLSKIENLSWNPDASSVLMKRSDGVYMYNFSRDNLVNQTMTLWATDIDQIAWSPSGVQIAYTYYPTSGEKSLILADAQNKNIRRVINLDKENINHPQIGWSPDGKYIYLISTSQQVNSNYLYVYDATVDVAKRVSETANVKSAVWSPDEQYIAYVAPGGSGENTVWSVTADGENNKDMNISVSGPNHIGWASDSQSLIVSKDYSLHKIDLNGTNSTYQFKNDSGKVDATFISQITGENRSVFVNNNQLYSVTLTTTGY